MFSTCRSGFGPQTMASATSSSVTSDVACSKCCGVGSSWASSPGNCSLAHNLWAVLHAPLPEEAHDLYGLFEHLQAHVGGRPAVPEDVLVEVLAGADAKGEASPQHDRRGRRGLG